MKLLTSYMKSFSSVTSKPRTTEEDLEEANAKENRKDSFEGGCPESSKVER